ncbi:hypothetical protein CTAYLR_008183 [Chrysophaeum taylorii]|uniref:Large ribosomal subunit protein bL12 C-terminal domain-containing protein n=1 Tax=Chrysophaeum taylorii TaxID=2483200 RepID=A0AAD7U950_9STRA|nr:hypothetical protein CTAYLR_008183 [Chrysophaeum taylorii]
MASEVRSLVEACLRVITSAPQCLVREEEELGDDVSSYASQTLRWWPEAQAIRCAPCIDAVCGGAWRDPWGAVRVACVGAATHGEARPQVACALGGCGRLVDGALPTDFWDGLKCDALSLAGSRAGPAIVRSLATAQRHHTTLVALDLGGCLLVDDDAVADVVVACEMLERLGLRDCRKLTNATLSTAARMPRLLDIDVGGDFNITPTGVRTAFLAPKLGLKSGKRKRDSVAAAAAAAETLVGVGVSGLGVDDPLLLDALVHATHLRRLGLGYGRFSAAAFISAVGSWTHLFDLRVQWTTSFDDACLDALAASCLHLRALDAVGTPVSVDALRRLLRRRAPPPEKMPVDDDFLPVDAGPKSLEWLSCRYTTGPKPLLQKLQYIMWRRGIRVLTRPTSRRLCAPPSPKIEALCNDVCALNVIELSQFLELFKDRVGLKDSDLMAAAPVAVAAPAAVAPVEEAPAVVEEKEFFNLKLTGFDAKAKIKIIKEVRAITGLGLKEAKEVVEGAPSVLKTDIKKEEAEELVRKLTELGGTAELE